MIVLFLAPGFEEVEALAPLDLLRRAGLEVVTVAINAPGVWEDTVAITGTHGITVLADVTEADFAAKLGNDFSPEAVILPGGMPGASNLDASATVEKTLELGAAKGAYLCAICAAPLVLGRRGYLSGKRATCYPGFEMLLEGAITGGKVIRDENIITAAGMGVAQEFGLEIISALISPEKAGEIRGAIQAM